MEGLYSDLAGVHLGWDLDGPQKVFLMKSSGPTGRAQVIVRTLCTLIPGPPDFSLTAVTMHSKVTDLASKTRELYQLGAQVRPGS